MNNCFFFRLLNLTWSLIILLSACQPNADATDVKNIKVDMVPFKRVIIDTEEILVPNCEGNIEIIQTLGSLKTIHTKSEVEITAVSIEGSEYKIPEDIRLQLEIEVANSYEQSFQNATARLENIAMNGAPRSETVYVIQWEQLHYQGNVQFSIGGHVYNVPYFYQLMIPKLLSKGEKACNGTNEIVTKSPQPTPDKSATPTFTALAPTEHTLVLRTKTYLYLGPQIAYGVVNSQQRLKGEEFNVIATTSAGDWFLVQDTNGTRGWLYITWVNLTFDVGLIPVTTDFPPPPPPASTPTKRPPPPSYP
jgi:hypothetical protein